jgi:serine/threonine-protein kinase RIO1
MPYNILWWRERMTIIDFPQACDARLNRNAREFLFRDIERVAAYFRTQGAGCDAAAEAQALWNDFEHARL